MLTVIDAKANLYKYKCGTDSRPVIMNNYRSTRKTFYTVCLQWLLKDEKISDSEEVLFLCDIN